MCIYVQREKIGGQEELFVCGYESALFACDQGCIHSTYSVEKHFLNGSEWNDTGKNIPE
jgi:hypothetical protein